MFRIEEIDPVYYRKQTRKSTLIIMGIFIVIGFISARLAVVYLSAYSNNQIVLNFLGAFAGLMLVFWIVSTFFKDADWMKEAMYAWRLKRHLMYIYNVLKNIQEAADQGDVKAINILRFYQLGTEQMYLLDNNNLEMDDLKIQMRVLESKMKEMGLEPNQTEFKLASADQYRN